MRKRTTVIHFLAVGLLLATGSLVEAELAFPVENGRYDTRILREADPVLAEIFDTANDIGFRVGTWGGASRDYLLGRGPPPEFSDVDMVFDSREMWQAMTSDGPIGFVKKMGRLVKGFWRVARVGGIGALRRYTYLDSKEGGKALTMSIPQMINSGGGTLNQVGLMSDGSVYDPTGGLEDIRKGELRYRVPKPIATMVEDLNDIHNPSPYDVLRMVRFKVQYPELEWAPGTYERLQEIMSLYSPGSEYTREVASYNEGLSGTLNQKIPDGLRHPYSALKVRLFGPDRKNLWPYFEKGMNKILKSSPDPVESLRILQDLGVDDFAREIGATETLEKLEEKARGHAVAAAALGKSSRDLASGQSGATSSSRASADTGAPSVLRQALEKVSRQAYENFLAAQSSGDMDKAREDYRIYLDSRTRLEKLP